MSVGISSIAIMIPILTPRLDTGSGVAFQVNYGRRFFKGRKVAIYGEINALANPLRDVSSSIPTATHDFASLYITPGIRVKFLPTPRISPYALVGGGYADYEQSTTRINGQPNSVSRGLARGVFDCGAESKFASGDSLPFEAKHATSTRARQPTASRHFLGGTMSSPLAR